MSQSRAPTRPLWRRLGARARPPVYRLITIADRVLRWRSSAVLPPAQLRLDYYYGRSDPDPYARGADAARTELVTRGLRPEHRVLDIGSGLGNLALGLAGYLHGGYDGLEIHPEAVAWCQRAITPRHPGFRFHRADVASRAYNPRGRVPASAYRFPFEYASVDFVFLASVFTQMLPNEVENYLREIGRVLAPAGSCVASFFLLNDETRAGIDAGRSFMSFAAGHPSGLCRLHDAAVPESAVAIDEAFVRLFHERAGLHIRDVRRGGWWGGEAHEQDVVTSAAAR